MQIILAALASSLLLAGCGEAGSCPNPPTCTKGQLCGCSCISASKKCTKELQEASIDAAWLAAEEDT